MIEEYRKELPKWIDNKADYDLVLSNDIDSLASCCLLKQIKGWDIGYYYSFDADIFSFALTYHDSTLGTASICMRETKDKKKKKKKKKKTRKTLYIS